MSNELLKEIRRTSIDAEALLRLVVEIERVRKRRVTASVCGTLLERPLTQ